MTAVLNAEQVDVGYDGGAVVSDINTSALRGQLICLLGPNGAGKSTILRTLSGHLAPLGGTVYIGGKSVTKMSENERAKKTFGRAHGETAAAHDNGQRSRIDGQVAAYRILGQAVRDR